MAAIVRAAPPDGSERRQERWLLLLLCLLWLALALPALLGARTLFQRDVFVTHLPLKAIGAAALAAGEIPAVAPAWALGQPFRGDPNALPFYPGNLLYLLLPFWSAFNLHYLLHWLLALFGMRRLAGELGQSPMASLLAGLTYAGSGYLLSLLTFYNLLTVAAWWPWAMAGLARGGRRGLAGAALAIGLAALGGEPVTLLLALLPLALVAVERHGPRRGLAYFAAAGAAGALVALPQIVATARVLGFTTRGLLGVPLEQVGRFALHPARLLELLLPLPFGWPLRYDAFGLWSRELFPTEPYVLSLHLGLVAVVLGSRALASRWRWGLLALAGAGAAWLGGVAPGALAALSGGLFRYPEKFLLWLALAVPLLAGWGLDRPPAGAMARRGLLLGAAASAALGLLGLAGHRSLTARVRGMLDPHPPAAAAETQALLLALALLAAALLLAGLAWASRPERRGALVLLQLAGLLQLAPLWATLPVREVGGPSAWLGEIPAGAAVAMLHLPDSPEARPDPSLRSSADLARARAAALDPAPGALHGLSYPLAPDLAGMQSPRSAILAVALQRLDWPQRVNWLRLLGADALVESWKDEAVPLPEIASRRDHGVVRRLRTVEHPAPPVWRPRQVIPLDEPRAVAAAVGDLADPTETAFTPVAVEHGPEGSVRLLDLSSDEIRIASAGDGGLVVLRRAYLPLYRATTKENDRLPTLPVDIALLGVVVPPGDQEVTVRIDGRPEAIAAAVSILALAAIALLALSPWRSR
ncbi:MAG TPA: hypothetical protein VLA75_10300 [Thermoanaerobaculia bacterium]|nr:hypothetical protein [Thermoanaerobaculia bacterium]